MSSHTLQPSALTFEILISKEVLFKGPRAIKNEHWVMQAAFAAHSHCLCDLWTPISRCVCAQSSPDQTSLHEGKLLCRENTEGEYSGLEHEVVPDVVESLKVITQVS